MLTIKHLTTASAALIDERKSCEYYGPHLVDEMSLDEMRAKRTEIDEAINALKEAATLLDQQAAAATSDAVASEWIPVENGVYHTDGPELLEVKDCRLNVYGMGGVIYVDLPMGTRLCRQRPHPTPAPKGLPATEQGEEG